MPSKIITSFEVLARPVAPLLPNVPYVQQGVFLQVTNLGGGPAKIDIEYIDTPGLLSAQGAVKLFADFIDQTGAPAIVANATFLAAPVGFKAQIIPAKATWLFGVQYLLDPPPAPTTTPATGATPQDAAEARGAIRIQAPAGTKLLLLATIRQTFNNYDSAGALIDIAEGAYALPLVGGPEHDF